MGDNSDGALFKSLAEFLTKADPDLDAIFRHGITAAQEHDHKCLADYFMVVSEIEGLPAAARDLAIDLSVHYGGVEMYKDFDPAGEYEKRTPAWLDKGAWHPRD
jgi:hypothetical protein